MKKKLSIKKNIKTTVTTVTTAGILFTGVSPSYAEEQQKQTPIELTDAEAKQEETLVDNIKENELNQNQEQINSNDAPATEQEKQPKGNETIESKVEQNASIQEKQNRITDSVQDAESYVSDKEQNVSTYAEFKAALVNESVKTINVMKDIVITEELKVNITESRNLTINGNADKHIKITSDSRMIFTGTGNVTLKNATIIERKALAFMRADPNIVQTVKDVKHTGKGLIADGSDSQNLSLVCYEGNVISDATSMAYSSSAIHREGSTYTAPGNGKGNMTIEKNAKVNLTPSGRTTGYQLETLTVKGGGELNATQLYQGHALNFKKGIVEEGGSLYVEGTGSPYVISGDLILDNPASYSIGTKNAAGRIIKGTLTLRNGDVNTWIDIANFEKEPWQSWKAVKSFEMSERSVVTSSDPSLNGLDFSNVRKIAGKASEKIPSAPKVNKVKDTDTKVTGTAQAGSTITIQVAGKELGTGTVDENGTYKITIPQQKAGTKLSVIASNSAGTSEATEVTVQATKLEKPTVNEVTNKDTKVTGKAKPHAKIEVVTNYQKAIYKGEADENGDFEVALNQPQKAGTKIGVKQSVGGKESEYTEVEVQAILVAPEINPVYTTDTIIKGKGIANTTAIAKVGGAEFVGKVDAEGNLQIDIENSYPVGTEISVYLKDAQGKEGAVTVVKVQEAWINPTVQEVTDQDEKVTGTGTVGAEVTVKEKGGKEIGKGIVGEDGTFTIVIPKQKAETQLEVQVVKGENKETKYLTVKDVTPPEEPKVSDVKATDTKVTGTGEVGTKVTIKEKNGAEIGTGTVDKDGNFSVEIVPKVAGTVLTITLTDKAGNVSKATEVTVKEGIASPTINDYYTTDAYAKGTAAGAKQVVIYVDGKLV
ncbi:hypothetical protein IEQ_05105, partial [Bacillus cereus BAG6X1-2]